MKTIHCGPENWAQTLPLLLAVFEAGTPKGKVQTIADLKRMAKVADVGVELHAVITEVLPDLEHYASTHGSGPDKRLAKLKKVLARVKA